MAATRAASAGLSRVVFHRQCVSYGVVARPGGTNAVLAIAERPTAAGTGAMPCATSDTSDTTLSQCRSS